MPCALHRPVVRSAYNWSRWTIRSVSPIMVSGYFPEELPHIFDRFYRVRRSLEGTGLGLAISQRIIEAHESTTFSFSFAQA